MAGPRKSAGMRKSLFVLLAIVAVAAAGLPGCLEAGQAARVTDTVTVTRTVTPEATSGTVPSEASRPAPELRSNGTSAAIESALQEIVLNVSYDDQIPFSYDSPNLGMSPCLPTAEHWLALRNVTSWRISLWLSWVPSSPHSVQMTLGAQPYGQPDEGTAAGIEHQGKPGFQLAGTVAGVAGAEGLMLLAGETDSYEPHLHACDSFPQSFHVEGRVVAVQSVAAPAATDPSASKPRDVSWTGHFDLAEEHGGHGGVGYGESRWWRYLDVPMANLSSFGADLTLSWDNPTMPEMELQVYGFGGCPDACFVTSMSQAAGPSPVHVVGGAAGDGRALTGIEIAVHVPPVSQMRALQYTTPTDFHVSGLIFPPGTA
jgi:hypothetical protein